MKGPTLTAGSLFLTDGDSCSTVVMGTGRVALSKKMTKFIAWSSLWYCERFGMRQDEEVLHMNQQEQPRGALAAPWLGLVSS